MSSTRRRHNLIDKRTHCLWQHILLLLVTVKKRLFSLYDYLAGETIRAILHCQTNIVRRAVSLDVRFPETRAQITRALSERQAHRYEKQTSNENSHRATILDSGYSHRGRKQQINALPDMSARPGTFPLPSTLALSEPGNSSSR